MTTARCLLALAASKGWFLHQMHVENDFLHGDLRQEIYMEFYRVFLHQNLDIIVVSGNLFMDINKLVETGLLN